MRYAFHSRIRDNFGNVLEGQNVSVFLTGGTTSAILFGSIATSAAPLSAAPQIQSDALGRVSFYIDDTIHSFNQLFDIVVDGITYERVDIYHRSMRYSPIDNSDWSATDIPGFEGAPDDLVDAVDELAEAVKNIDGGGFGP